MNFFAERCRIWLAARKGVALGEGEDKVASDRVTRSIFV